MMWRAKPCTSFLMDEAGLFTKDPQSLFERARFEIDCNLSMSEGGGNSARLANRSSISEWRSGDSFAPRGAQREETPGIHGLRSGCEATVASPVATVRCPIVAEKK